MELAVEWLGRIDYRVAWARQHALVAARAAGTIPDTLLLRSILRSDASAAGDLCIFSGPSSARISPIRARRVAK
jgi:hypothetical protein